MADVRRIEPPAIPMRVPKVAELVANDLRRKIIRGQLPVGDTLPNEPTLLEIYNVSRPTLREALRILESEGLVSVKRGAQGGRVHVPDISVAARHVALQLQVRDTTIDDLFTARRVIEPGAVRMLAETRRPADIALLREEVELQRSLLDHPDAYATAATRFHELLVELAGNNTLTIFSQLVMEIVDRHHHDTFARAGGLEREYTHEASDHHGQVVDLIEKGAAEEAETFWRTHIDGAAERAMRHLGPKTIVDLLG